MVGVPGKYKGCETCRRRRVKCDNMRPICRKCVSTGRNCEGYERQMIFITATPEDGGRCSSHPPRSTSKKVLKGDSASIKSQGSRNSQEGNTPSPPISASSSYSMSQQLPVSTAPSSNGSPVIQMPLSPSEPLRSAWDDIIFLSDKHTYYPIQFVSLQTRLDRVSRGISGTLSPRNYELPDLRPVGNDCEFSVGGQCIVSVDSPNEAKSGLCVFLYEPNNYAASPAEIPPWKAPHDYMSMAQVAGPQAFEAFPAHHFFSRVYRPSSIAWALLTRKPTHLAQRDWVTAPWQYHPKSTIDHLFDILVQLPDLLERSDMTSHHVPTQARQLKIQELLTGCLYLERQLNEWCSMAAQGPDDAHRHSYWVNRPPHTETSIPFSETFAFIDATTAVSFLYYWMGSLLLNRCILTLHRLFFQPAIDYGMYPVLPAELNIDVSNYQRDRMFATNICCALDFAVNTSTQPDILAGPLAIAEMYFEELKSADQGQGQLESAWCDGFKRRMMSKGQHIVSIVASRQWSECGRF
ncbi:hypothetical protein BROUX41_003948 [Berkeleyomyces rouxiae]|uniref:uncharacterized protein n=1 Tax=Berkeleyomyces rouxiae TaxID=2035830 RepID=UPI003B7B7584